MTPPGTENSEGHSDINIPPIIAAHIGVSSVNDAVLTDESFVAPIPNKIFPLPSSLAPTQALKLFPVSFK